MKTQSHSHFESIHQWTGECAVAWFTDDYLKALEYASYWGFNGYPFVLMRKDNN